MNDKKNNIDFPLFQQGVEMIVQALAIEDTIHLQQTSKLMTACWKEHFLTGYEMSPESIFEEVMQGEFTSIVTIRNIHFHGMCPHHFLPFFGKATVAYLPRRKILGFSRVAEVVKCFTQRLTLQEMACEEIANSFVEYLGVKGVAVVLEAQQLCMSLRNPATADSIVRTESVQGIFKTDSSWRSSL